MSFDLTNKNISDTFQNLLQRTGSDNHLHDLEGNKIGDLRISGSLIAQQYIVSSSVTNITTQQLSGSTEFGDSSDDSHTFQGNITASGNISASKTDGVHVFGGSVGINTISPDSELHIHHATNADLKFSTDISGQGATDGMVIGAGGGVSDGFIWHYEPNADFAIATANSERMRIMNTGKIGINETTPASQLDIDGDLKVQSHITASGNISSSGDLIGNQLIIDDSGKIVRVSADEMKVTDTDGGALPLFTFKVDKVDFIGAQGLKTTHITASGNISSSGTITAKDFTNITTAGNISASGTSHIFNGISLFGDSANDQVRISDGITTGMLSINNESLVLQGSTANPIDDTNTAQVLIDPNANMTLNKGTTGGGSLFTENHITASGNISASGNILTSGTGSFTGGIDSGGDIYISDGNALYLSANKRSSIREFSGAEVRITADSHINMMPDNDVIISPGGINQHIFNQGNNQAAGGKVGISTTTPTVTLQVSGSISSSGDFFLENSASFGGALTSSATVTVAGDISASGTIIASAANFNDGNITNVGVIDVDNIRADAADGVQITLSTGGVDVVLEDNDAYTINSGEIDADFIYYDSSEAELIHADAADSRVGIGTATPSKTLTVAGDISASGAINTLSHITASGNISASGTLIADDITVAAVTGIDSILATDLILGEDAQTKIDFETANEIHFYANNAQEMIVQANVVAPGADDGTALGDADQRWSDLFLAEGAVINFDDGDVTMTQTADNLTIAGGSISSSGDLRVVGNISASSDLVIGGLGVSSGYISASNGNIELSGSGDAILNIDGIITSSGKYFEGLHHLVNTSATASLIPTNAITQSILVENSNTASILTRNSITQSILVENSNTASILTRNSITQSILVENSNTASILTRNSITQSLLVENTATSSLVITQLSASSAIFAGIKTGAFVSSSNGNVEISGSGKGQIEVDYRLFDTGSISAPAGAGVGDVVKFGGTTTTAGLVYYLTSAGGWAATDADAGGTTSGSIAVALGTNSTNAGMLMRGIVALGNDPGGDIGASLYLSSSAGQVTSAAPGTGDFSRVIGFKISGSRGIYFNPDNTTIQVA